MSQSSDVETISTGDARLYTIEEPSDTAKQMEERNSAAPDFANQSQTEQPAPWATINVYGENLNYPGQKGNEIRTTRYRWYSFIPMTFLEQYRVLSNIYYIFVLIVCFLPMSPVHYLFQLVPMIVVLIVSMIKSGVEDLLKHFEDKKRNQAPTLVYRSGSFVTVNAEDVNVGDIVKLEEDQMVPSDLLFIGSNQESSLCYFSETNLNGETAVKTMQAHPAFEGQDPIENVTHHKYQVDLAQPDRDLTRFDARLRCGNQVWSISINNVLLRGVTTHYTDCVIGIALRTGHDTKIMENVHTTPSKLTKFDRNLNRILIIVFVFKMILCLLSTFLGVWLDKGQRFPLISKLYPGYGQSFFEYFTQYFVLYSYLFPISLTVTIEIIRLFHKILIQFDPYLYDPEFGHGVAHNSNVICQLGLVSHILTDKTGTLTENQMQLLQFATYNGVFNAAEYLKTIEADPTIVSPNLPFLLAMAICNNVIVHKRQDGALEYNADSPDEAAFVDFASKCGIKLIARGLNSLTVDISGTKTTYDILAQLPFNSDRKRMSIIVKAGDQPAIIYTKGSDNIIAERSIDYNYVDTVNAFATAGLRTLVFASRELKDEELDKWLNSYRDAESSLTQREEKVGQCASMIEDQLNTIGVSGVEDRLQPEVPETIHWIREAGIKLWVLTGDKLETAIAIGRTSGVIQPNNDIMMITVKTKHDVEHEMDSFLNSIDSFNDPILIVTAEAVEIALEQDLLPKFMTLADKCSSVILSRVSPFMKGHVTQVVKNAGRQTLSVGDGANDVGMIQIADVGVGIYGREGSQAAMSSDFAIPRFKHLRRALMVHGHWTYRRFAIVAIMMIYKNIVFIFAQLWFEFDALWSPTSFYADFVMSFFNLFFTVLPPFIFGFWEQDLSQDVLLNHPQLYPCEFDPMSVGYLFNYIILSSYQSVVCYFGPRLTMVDFDLRENSMITYLAAVYVVIVQIILWMGNQNTWTYVIWAINIVLVPFIIIVNILISDSSLYPVIYHTFASANAWLVFLICIVISVLPGFLIEYTRERFFPTKHRIFQERDYLRKMRKEPKQWGTNSYIYEKNDESEIELKENITTDAPPF